MWDLSIHIHEPPFHRKKYSLPYFHQFRGCSARFLSNIKRMVGYSLRDFYRLVNDVYDVHTSIHKDFEYSDARCGKSIYKDGEHNPLFLNVNLTYCVLDEHVIDASCEKLIAPLASNYSLVDNSMLLVTREFFYANEGAPSLSILTPIVVHQFIKFGKVESFSFRSDVCVANYPIADRWTGSFNPHATYADHIDLFKDLSVHNKLVTFYDRLVNDNFWSKMIVIHFDKWLS